MDSWLTNRLLKASKWRQRAIFFTVLRTGVISVSGGARNVENPGILFKHPPFPRSWFEPVSWMPFLRHRELLFPLRNHQTDLEVIPRRRQHRTESALPELVEDLLWVTEDGSVRVVNGRRTLVEGHSPFVHSTTALLIVNKNGLLAQIVEFHGTSVETPILLQLEPLYPKVPRHLKPYQNQYLARFTSGLNEAPAKPSICFKFGTPAPLSREAPVAVIHAHQL